MNRKLRDIFHLGDLDTAIIVNAALELGACVVLAESEKFQPVAAMVFQGPGHKADLLDHDRDLRRCIGQCVASAPHG